MTARRVGSRTPHREPGCGAIRVAHRADVGDRRRDMYRDTAYRMMPEAAISPATATISHDNRSMPLPLARMPAPLSATTSPHTARVIPQAASADTTRLSIGSVWRQVRVSEQLTIAPTTCNGLPHHDHCARPDERIAERLTEDGEDDTHQHEYRADEGHPLTFDHSLSMVASGRVSGQSSVVVLAFVGIGARSCSRAFPKNTTKLMIPEMAIRPKGHRVGRAEHHRQDQRRQH